MHDDHATDYPTAAECCTHNCNQGRTCPKTMKPSHLQTPRTLSECHFQTGYKSADLDDRITVWGHVLATVFGVAIIVVLVAVELGAFLP